MDLRKKIEEVLDVYKNANFRVFTRNGLIFTIILTIVFFSFYLFNFTLTFPLLKKPVPVFHFDLLAIIAAIVSSIFIMAIWWILGTSLAPKVGSFLTENKIANILFTKGDVHYFEKVDQENLRIMPGTVIAKFINILLAWFAVTAFLLGFLLQFFQGATNSSADKLYAFFTSDISDPFNFLLKILIVFVLAPLLMTITVPIPWMLLDTRLKAYNSGTKVNTFVGTAVQTRLNSLFAIGGIITLIIQNLSIDTIVLVIVFIFGILAFPAMIMITLYNMLFQVQYYESFLREIPVPFGTIKLETFTKNAKNNQPNPNE